MISGGDTGDVGKIPWRRAWHYTPVFLPGESPWTEEPGGLQSMGSQRVGHDQGCMCAHGHALTHTHTHTIITQMILLVFLFIFLTRCKGHEGWG